MDEKPARDLDILFKAFDHSRTEGSRLRERALTIHTWIGSILSALIGFIVAFNPQQLSNSGQRTQLLLTVTAISLLIFGWLTELLTFKARVKEHQATLRIVRLLHLFDDNYFGAHTPIFDEREWTGWMKSPLRNLGISPATAILTVLTGVAVAIVWSA